ncbi:MAG: hypothetical protein DRP85_03555 [Candidatus Makaraimicrobium thalassicum]|nr:MAG: hypothetical protein DRP85_03555 [Candidatus Omnitrophota bacterium]
MRKISDIIRHNRLYAVLLVFIIGINLVAFMGWMAERAGEKAETTVTGVPVQDELAAGQQVRPAERTLFDSEDVNARRAKLEGLLRENPLLSIVLGVLNLMALYVIFVGLILDMYFLIRWLRKEPVRIRVVRQEKPRWSVADVVRVAIIFVACSYIFVILQGSVTEIFPVLSSGNFRMVFNTAVMSVVGISVILYFIVRKYGHGINAIGLSFRGFFRNLRYAFVGYVALIPILFAIMLAIFFVTKWLGYHPPVQSIVTVFIEEKETSVLWFSALFVAVFGPVAEEIFFRGFMYTAVRKRWGVFRAMVGTSAVFSCLHTHVVGFFPIMALGLLLAYLYEKTGSLAASISVHIMHNVGMVILVFLVRCIGT